MNKIFRLWGIVVFLVIAGLFYFFTNPLIELALEKAGEAAFDAKVDIAKVKLDYTEAKLSIYGAEVGDKDKPMQNLFQFNQATADLALLKAFLGQVVVEDLNLTGLEFAKARKYSAALKHHQNETSNDAKSVGTDSAKAEKPEEQKEEKPSIDIDEILAKELLQTQIRYDDLQTYVEEQEVQWEKIESELPSSDKLFDYEKRVKAITDGSIKSLDDFNKRRKALSQVQKEMSADKKKLEQAQDFLKNNQKVLPEKLTALKDAPSEDVEYLKNKYQFNEVGAANMIGLLFGQDIQNYAEQALYWYQKVRPILQSDEEERAEEKPSRGEGRYIYFGQKEPATFWIKRAKIQATVVRGDYLVEIRNLSHQQNRTHQPITIVVNSQAVNNMKSLTANAEIDYRKKPYSEQLTANVIEYGLKDKAISGSDDIQLSLSKALVNMQLEARRLKDDSKLQANMQFTQAEFIGEGSSTLTQELAAAMSKITEFDANIEAQNGLKDMSINSNLDKQLKNILNQRVDEEKAAFEQKLQTKLNAQLNEQLKKLNLPAELSNDADIKTQLANIDELLKSKLDDYKDQQVEKAKDKAKDELKKKLKSLF